MFESKTSLIQYYDKQFHFNNSIRYWYVPTGKEVVVVVAAAVIGWLVE